MGPRTLSRRWRAHIACFACVIAAPWCCSLYEGRTLELFPELAPGGAECATFSDCPAQRPFCLGGSCLECLADGDCGRGKPACFGNVCVECRSAEHCGPGQSCNVALSTCSLACAESSDCAGLMQSHCSGELGVCVQCQSDLDCGERRRPACDRGGACVECLADVHCPPDRPSCRMSSKTCVECIDSTQCDGRTCDARDGRCVDCRKDTDCPLGGTCDVARRRCQLTCTGTADCDPMHPVCDAATNLCVACTSDADCDARRPACSAEQQCVECTNDEHCTQAGRPACLASARCGECSRDQHCPETMRCDLAAARCEADPGAPDTGPPAPER